jgi:1,4-dihydroxy-2-naphthoyl-CoA hydrolase
MPLWKQQPTLDLVNGWSPNTMIEALGIRFTDIGEDYLRGTMPVDERKNQPYRLMHGGARSRSPKRSATSPAMLTLDPAVEVAVGLDRMRSRA